MGFNFSDIKYRLQAETYKTGSDGFNNLNKWEFRKDGHQTPT